MSLENEDFSNCVLDYVSVKVFCKKENVYENLIEEFFIVNDYECFCGVVIFFENEFFDELNSEILIYFLVLFIEFVFDQQEL